MKPGTKDKEIKIIFTSSTRLTDEELRASNIKVSAKKVDKTTPVFINKNEFALIPITLREDRQALLQFSKAGKSFDIFMIITLTFIKNNHFEHNYFNII